MRQENTNIYSVAQVNTYIKNLFARDFALRQICVRGEVSNCKYHSSGHIYFSLKDRGGVLACVMFAGNRSTGLTFRMTEGMQVVVTGSVQVYERTGSYQLYAREIRREGQGDLYLRMEELKKKLEEMGMFAPEYKQPIPRFAKRVGIVTASTGAAIRDICNISHRRNPFVQLILFPAIVQGEYAAPSIVQGIETLDAMGLDVLIVGRGGGSIEDLWAFNEESVARAVFNCRTPVISAVGHETDVTIIDYVADLRAPTPSAAAELAVYDVQSFLDQIRLRQNRLSREMTGRLEREKLRLSSRERRLERHDPGNELEIRRQGLINRERQLTELMNGALRDRKHDLSLAAARLEALSPLAQMQKGYAFVSKEDGSPVRSVEETQVGTEVQIAVSDGLMKARITEKTSLIQMGDSNG